MNKDKQNPVLRKVAEEGVVQFAAKYPVRTIGHHHYLRRRNLEQFLYDFAHNLVDNCGAPVLYKCKCFNPIKPTTKP